MSSKSNGFSVCPGTVLSGFCLLLYSAGFIRIEVKFNDHEQRLVAVEEVISRIKQGMADTLIKENSALPDSVKKEVNVNQVKLQRSSRSVANSTPYNKSANLKQVLEDVVTSSFKKICHNSGNLCPRGLPGPPGRRGRKGSKGMMGQPGRSGKQGIIGPPGIGGDKGMQGDTGAPGIQGAKGSKGDTGAPGVPGAKGIRGVTGAPGIPGAKGIKGDTGAPGVPGMKGSKGMMGQPGISGKQGIMGPPGIRGEKGNKGDTGALGIPGQKGIKGNTGAPSRPACLPVGVEDINKIPDARMTASVYQNIFAYPYYGRLNERRGDRWCPKTPYDRSDYLQVDMGAANLICAVATQGMKGSTDRTTSYKLRISLNGVTWKSYTENNVEKVFPGNTDDISIVKNSLSTAAKARFVRFYPVTYQGWPCLRVEIYVLK